MHDPDITVIASLIGEPTRARMLLALMSGKALTATELALEADITAQTASSHLSKLLDSSLITVRKQGRHKYFQLKSQAVAELIEQLLTLSSSTTLKTNTGPNDPYLRQARVCYDHIAGELGVQLYDALVAANYLEDKQAQTLLTPRGTAFFEQLGVCFSTFREKKRPICKSCLDWSERRNHLAGSLGNWILNDALERGWLQRVPDSRALIFSGEAHRRRFAKSYGLKLTDNTEK
ncbi:ArsR/SmtB family transcription factor [Pseudoalteromonas ardens]|uniref:ArsR family transcriptional regulator n=1 Tax=Pseudoalteromonas rubra TaxID=43658 RepID=A0A0L0EVH8_9GAMM|nr:helix-turn-helix transcriptional regulator [Pseudoalteromonas sp. R96]KNC68414.1 ArsR family transcriptional regulator [Pseudoalteromonas rubra]MDK1313416.1 helix-turn-helix transcriptional regulator [Pseudoalteromonas sp. R96]